MRRRGLPWQLLRVFVLAGFGVAASIWGIMRANRPRPPMVVPLSPPSAADATIEILAPELTIVPPDPPAR